MRGPSSFPTSTAGNDGTAVSAQLANQVDLAFLDGTFSSADEVRGRRIEEIPHPMVPETRALLKGARAKLWFIHLNHTNPALEDAVDVAREGMEFPL